MIIKPLNVIAACVFFLALNTVNSANATLIPVEDWHLTTDDLGGLRQSSASENVFYAVSKIWTLDRTDTFEPIAGYYFATHQEWRDLVGFAYNANRGYRNQGGWNEYEWEGVERRFFLFADSLATGWYKHAGNNDTTSNQTNFYQGRTGMAGFVMIKGVKPNVTVPESSTLVLFLAGVMGLLSCRLRKS
ncbi:PEP-CTERM sorting domain-containing protein [Thalassotalea piscium]